MALKEEGVARGHFEVRGYRRNGKPIRGSCLRRSDGVDSHGENARRCEVAREISDRRPFVREEACVSYRRSSIRHAKCCVLFGCVGGDFTPVMLPL